MRIVDPEMRRRFDKALSLGGGLYTLDDIEKELLSGGMQGHATEDTWAITRVHDWPQKRSVDIVFAVGRIEGALKLEEQITHWAKAQGAQLLTAMGREGWWEYRAPGWSKVGVLYSKDLNHEPR